MGDLVTSLSTAIKSAEKVASTPLFTTVIDKVTGFKISEWAAESEVRKKLIYDQYEEAKKNGIVGVQYIKNLRHTTNLIDVAVKSTKYIDSQKANEVKMDNDFFWNAIEYSKTISGEEMQELIARIIAGEYNSPGSYSMSTLYSVKLLGKNELELFEKTCSLLINRKQIPQALFLLPKDAIKLLTDLHIDFGSLQTLQGLGLFLSNSMMMSLENLKRDDLVMRYFDKRVVFEPINENSFEVKLPGFYSLSIAGEQILKHLHPEFNTKYFKWLKDNYRITNYKSISKSKSIKKEAIVL